MIYNYNYIKKSMYGNKAKLFTDTHSLTYELIEAIDVYRDFWTDKDNSTTVIIQKIVNTNKKVIGKFKDEVSGVPV